ncbi:MAG: hypothetical protein OXI13_03565 [Gammaproteobacteria bacterium]|nr:hypothetical protein [Gammaproteobacteria bacterium]
MPKCRKATLATMLLLGACATNDPFLDIVSDDNELESAREDFTEKIEELTAAGELSTNAQIAEQVRQIAEKLVAAAISEWPHTKNWDWTIAFVDDPETTLPATLDGGYMFFDSATTDDEPILTDDEQAFAIAYYIVDSATNYRNERIGLEAFRWGGVIALHAVLGPAGGLVSGLGYETGLLRSYNRALFLEFDEISLRLALKAGYDPGAAITYFDKYLAWHEQNDENPYDVGGFNQFLIFDYVTEERYANFERLVTEFSQLTPSVPTTPHPIRIIYDSSNLVAIAR